MDSPLSAKDKRIKERWQQVKQEAIKSRKFSQQELTSQAVEFLLFGLLVDKNRDKIIKNVRRVD